jgi:hypothetical protein
MGDDRALATPVQLRWNRGATRGQLARGPCACAAALSSFDRRAAYFARDYELEAALDCA